MALRRSYRLTLVVLLLALVVPLVVTRARTTFARDEFVGSARCASCHSLEASAWDTSQHARAIQVATPRTVLGRFDGTRFTYAGVTTTLFRRGADYVVNTEGPDGAFRDYKVRYAFGVFPLQQYLLELPGGRLQALGVSWDSRPDSVGGQRWFFLFPGNRIEHTDSRHWTGRRQNWNFMCADCHSTAVRKGYQPATDSYNTTRSELSVGCEACHGPGSRHAAGTRYPQWMRSLLGYDTRLPARLDEHRSARWVLETGARTAHRSVLRTNDREIETCAQCHARRVHMADGYTAGKPLLDYYIPSLLMPGLYHPDGQQQDEVYTYASFAQSKMYAVGVTCSDCHEPHSAKPRAPGNAVCAQCHRPAAYDTSAHHFHPAGPGTSCVGCHMPTTTYMQVDARHDHSMRIPRPDLTERLGVPNACAKCHADRSASWAAAQIRAHFPNPNPGFQHFANVFAADERGEPWAPDSLAAMAGDATVPWLVRASALARLSAWGGTVAQRAGRSALADPHPLVRLAALQALETLPPPERIALAVPRLRDSTRSVRQAAAWLLAPVSRSLRDSADRIAYARAEREFIDAQLYNADQSGNRLSLGALYYQLGQLDSAIAEFRAAVRLDPTDSVASQALQAALRERR